MSNEAAIAVQAMELPASPVRPPVMRVLIVEDEQKIAEALVDGLTAEGYSTVVERTGEDGFLRASTDAFDVILLDLALPGRSGLDVLAHLRQQRNAVPVLVMSARDSVDDRVRGLDAGADDYLVKPFAFSELLARMRAINRRGQAAERTVLKVGSLCLNAMNREVTSDGVVIEFSAREFDLLAYLMRYEGQAVSRDALARDVWQEAGRSPSFDNVVDVYIARLRRKLDGNATLLHTLRGVGFMLRDGQG